MADPLSITASVVTLLQLSKHLIQHIKDIKSGSTDRQKLLIEISSISGLLHLFQDQADESKNSPSEAWALTVASLSVPNGPLDQLKEALERLVEKLQPKKGIAKVNSIVNWPFSKKEVQEVVAQIERLKSLFALAIQNDHKAISNAIKHEIDTIHQEVLAVKDLSQQSAANGERRRVLKWLAAIDPSTNHDAARRKQQPGTGLWLLNNDPMGPYAQWKASDGPTSLLWLTGIPGCGKTILCSQIVQDITDYCKTEDAICAYYYFDFNESSRCRRKALLQSIVSQIVSVLDQVPDVVKDLHLQSLEGTQTPSEEGLVNVLRTILRTNPRFYLIVDAVDECTERAELLDFLQEIRSWSQGNIKMLCLSRKERDIETAMTDMGVDHLELKAQQINPDILLHIRRSIEQHARLRRWKQDVKDEMERELVKGANGMFRWVVCQLDVLGKCLKINVLRKALRSLPSDLEDTYLRILLSIEEDYANDARAVFQYLVHCLRPMRIEEIAEVIAFDVDDEIAFEPDNRLSEPRELLAICSSLATIRPAKIEIHGRISNIEQLRLAHFSVQEYLVSSSIRGSEASRFHVSPDDAHLTITETSLVYLSKYTDCENVNESMLEDFPLLRYASENWVKHLGMITPSLSIPPALEKRIATFLSTDSRCFVNWIRLWDPDEPLASPDFTKEKSQVATPLYYAALCGSRRGVKILLQHGHDVNEQSGKYGNAMQAAASVGDEEVVELLLRYGSDLSTCCGQFGYPLFAALYHGHISVAEILLGHQSDIEQSDLKGRTALSWAASGGSANATSLVLQAGANLESKDNTGRTSLLWAVEEGRLETVRALLAAGADISARDNDGLTPIIRAAKRGFGPVVSYLLRHGAQVNDKDRRDHTALMWAAKRGNNIPLVTALITHGADLNCQDNTGISILGWAKKRSNTQIHKLLLDHGADDDSARSWWGHAVWESLIPAVPNYEDLLQSVKNDSYMAIVQRFLDAGADIALKGANGYTCLIWASEAGHYTVVQQLLGHPKHEAAHLEEACHQGHTALLYASKRGHSPIVELLVNAGANLDAADAFWSQSALIWAAKRNHVPVVKLLVDGGAQVDYVDKESQTALSWAAKRGYGEIVSYLVGRGANIEIKSRSGETALFHATRGKFEEVVRILSSYTIDDEDGEK